MEKRTNGKKIIKINLSLVLCPTIYLARPLLRCIRNLKTLALIEAKKSLIENLIGEIEKMDK